MRAQTLRHKPLELELAADAKVLGELRTALRLWLQEWGVLPEDIFKIVVAVGEAATNAIEHAYGPTEAMFQVMGLIHDDRVAVTVQDFGTWRRARGRNRGRGIKLMRALMDTVRIDRSSKGSAVRLSRRIALGRTT